MASKSSDFSKQAVKIREENRELSKVLMRRFLRGFQALEEQREVWQAAVLKAVNKVPSGKIVKDIVERLKEKPLSRACDFCQVGDVFVLTRLEGKEREYNGCWAIALQLNEFTVEVAVHDSKLIVKPENLNKIDSPEAQHQLPLLKERIWRLRNCGELDRGAYTVLESLGRQTYLTPVSEGLLRWLEEYYGVGNLDSDVKMDNRSTGNTD